MTGVKERVGDSPAAQAAADLLRRSVETFIDMQQEFLKIAGKQTHTWVESAKAGKLYQGEHVVELAREAMENFVKAQKHFMDVIAEETAKATGGKHSNGAKKLKKTELAQLARQATESFIEAQKKLVDVAGRQMNASVKTAGKTLELLRPFPFLPLAARDTKSPRLTPPGGFTGSLAASHAVAWSSPHLRWARWNYFFSSKKEARCRPSAVNWASMFAPIPNR
jgi:hypothetical protein